MTYAEAEHFLFYQLANYLRTGNLDGTGSVSTPTSATLPSRANILAMLYRLGNPHASPNLEFVHVAGTNGKGTVSHCIAAMCTGVGIRTGLYTSPHYASFRERIKLDGRLIPEADVVEFVERYSHDLLDIGCTYFEATAAMAFWFFRKEKVELAVLEVGLGGTWDASNVMLPLVSVITNIGFDHQEVLGHTLQRIAAEKAGIIKARATVVVGRRQAETTPVFAALAAGLRSKLVFAEDAVEVAVEPGDASTSVTIQAVRDGEEVVDTDLQGPFVAENIRTAIATFVEVQSCSAHAELARHKAFTSAVHGLRELKAYGYIGRFHQLSLKPRVIADAGHNAEAWAEVLPELTNLPHQQLHVVCGFKNGKDARPFFAGLPAGAIVYLTQSSALGMPTDQLLELSPGATSFARVGEAYEQAVKDADVEDLIFVGGSSYIVGDLLAYLKYWN